MLGVQTLRDAGQCRVQVLDNSGNTHKFLDPIRPILVRDLFRHTSGITYCRHSDEEHTQPYYEKEGLFYHGPEEIYPPNMTTEEGVRRLARIPLLHDPGKKFSYGFNTDILGRLVEIWSGLPLDQYVDRSICKPLGMVDTAFFVPQEKVDRFASLHARRNGKLTVIASGKDSPYIKGFKWISGGGGLVSTALDYGRFCLMVLNGGAYHGHRVLKSRTVSLLFTDQLSPATGPVKFGERVSAQGFGLGFALKDIVLGSGSLERPSTTYTWGGYANTSFDIIPDANLIQVFFRQEVPSNNELSKIIPLIKEEMSNVTTSDLHSLSIPLTVDINSGEIVEAQYNRSDICQVPPACVIGEAMLALCLSEVAIEKFGGDHIEEMISNFSSYQKSHKEFGINQNEN